MSCNLSSIFLFDTLSLDFEVAEILLVTFGGQMRALSSYATPKEGKAWQLNQRLSPSEKLQVKVSLFFWFIVRSFPYIKGLYRLLNAYLLCPQAHPYSFSGLWYIVVSNIVNAYS